MLKALELSGFKSFADKTRLDFHAGVTCVVGPNGSGKSNVVDAIKWVTGSQSPKALRGKEMTDVIFNGSTTRRAMNAAEVTLEFDNSNGLFDLPSPTARFTRRVYRSGEGEYLLNGSPTRLRDIRSLLAGTGVGAEAYSIIEQGRVDGLLRASPKDRRAIFEEAAGVSRFRLKKNEAGKRLARVEQNLLRLSDIVDEVEGRLRRVKKQAGKAQRYRDSSERLKDLRTRLGLADWSTLQQRSTRLTEEISELHQQQQADASTLAAAEEELARLEQQGGGASRRLADIDTRLADVREKMGAARAKSEAEFTRLDELREELTHKRNRLVGALAQRQSPGASNDDTLAEQTAAAVQERATAGDSLRRAEQELSDVEQSLSDLKDKVVGAEQDAQAARETLDAAVRERDKLTELHKKHHQRLEELQARRAASEEQRQSLEARALEAERLVGEAAESLQASVEQLEVRQANIAALRTRLDVARDELAKREAEAVSLRHQVEAIEKQETDIDALLDAVAARSNDSAGWNVLGVVADVLNVDYETAPMVEAALAGRAHHLVLDSGRALMAELAGNATSLASRANFQRLDCQAAASVVDRVDLSGEPGVMGRADRFVECEAPFVPLVRRLLGRIWFVDTLATAQRLADGPGKGLGFVTYNGDTLTADGLLTIGPKEESHSLLTRKARLQELRSELAETQEKIERLSKDSASLTEQVARGEADGHFAIEQRATASDANADARHAAQRLKEQLLTRQQECETHSQKTQQLEQSMRESEASLKQATDRAAQATPVWEACKRTLDALSSQAESVAADAEEQRKRIVEHQVLFAKAEQRAEVLEAQQRQAQHSGAEQGREREEAVREVAICQQRIVEHELRLLNASSAFNLHSIESQELVANRGGLQAESAQAIERRSKIVQAVRQRRDEAEQIASDRQRCEIRLAETQHEQTALADRLRDDYSIDLATAAQEAEQANDIEDRDAIEQEIASLREDVHSVGAVNLESIEELDDLESRFNELSSQYQDLSEAKSSLERLTQQLNVESRKLFLATIEAVRGEFRELFRQLFGGGEADLVLVDGEGDDPLDAGVEIAAQPPGKELSNITLLSGGEKTLTCVALLLALFRTKPSPFCVLDEVDAALDEANIGRFTGVLSEFLSSTQFIVVTHSKKTMADANTMYGITMQESGISKQVAVRFEEVDEQGNIRPARTLAPSQKAA